MTIQVQKSLKVGDTEPCPGCGKTAVWDHCLQCQEFFLNHSGIICPVAVGKHVRHPTISKEDEMYSRRASTEKS